MEKKLQCLTEAYVLKKLYISTSRKTNDLLVQTCGGFSLGIMKRTLIGWISAKGGSPLAISIAVIPRDHISAYI
jgi:hypothetical protein